MNNDFEIVGPRPTEIEPQKTKRRSNFPVVAVVVLSLIVFGSIFAPLITSKDPTYLDLANYNHPPNSEFFFGTDNLGRDIFSCIWYGGRISIFIGLAAAALSTVIAVTYGTLSAFSHEWTDKILQRFIEIVLSIPNLLLIIILLAPLGTPNEFKIAFVIGLTSWPAIAKVVRTEVKQLAANDFVTAARAMGGGFFYILRRHLWPNFMPTIMFMIVMNVRTAIVYESTLSFMGLGLPLSVISWGSMLSLAEKALLTDTWWIILLPGFFLVALLLSLASLGNYFRREGISS